MIKEEIDLEKKYKEIFGDDFIGVSYNRTAITRWKRFQVLIFMDFFSTNFDKNALNVLSIFKSHDEHFNIAVEFTYKDIFCKALFNEEDFKKYKNILEEN
jgi:hypothetical protein